MGKAAENFQRVRSGAFTALEREHAIVKTVAEETLAAEQANVAQARELLEREKRLEAAAADLDGKLKAMIAAAEAERDKIVTAREAAAQARDVLQGDCADLEARKRRLHEEIAALDAELVKLRAAVQALRPTP